MKINPQILLSMNFDKSGKCLKFFDSGNLVVNNVTGLEC